MNIEIPYRVEFYYKDTDTHAFTHHMVLGYEADHSEVMRLAEAEMPLLDREVYAGSVYRE